MKNLNYLKLALTFVMAAQSTGLLAMKEPAKQPEKTITGAVETLKTGVADAAEATGNFFTNNPTAVISTLVGGTALGLGFLGGSIYTAATYRSFVPEEPKSIFSFTNIALSLGAIAGFIYAYNKKADIINWCKSKNKWERFKDSSNKLFIEKPKSAWNWLTDLFIDKEEVLKDAKEQKTKLETKKANAKEDSKFTEKEEEELKAVTKKIDDMEKEKAEKDKAAKTEEKKTEETKTEEKKTEETKTEEKKTEEKKA